MKSKNKFFGLIIGLLLLISIADSIPVNFTANPLFSSPSSAIQFNDTSIGSTGWAWFFGDETYNQSWVQQNASGELYGGRTGHCTVSLPNGNIVLTGGEYPGFYDMNDTWRSTDKGVTWVEMTTP